jgi:hypothetical protein
MATFSMDMTPFREMRAERVKSEDYT